MALLQVPVACKPYEFNYSRGGKGDIARNIVLGACAVGIVGAASCIKIVSTGDECLVERLGKFHRSLGPGIHFVLSPIECISFQDTIREQVMDVPPQDCFTQDNAPLNADAVMYMRIHNMKDACYNVFNVRNALLNLCLTNVREEVGRLTLEEAFSSRGELNKRLLASLNKVSHGWGIEITRVEIQHLEPSADILKALESQISAERKKRATILQSEGEKAKLINEAQGRAEAMLADAEAKKKSMILASQAEAERQSLEAEGIQIAIQTIANSIISMGADSSTALKEAIKFLGLARYMETQGKFAASEGTKVLMFPTKVVEGLSGLLQ